MHQAFGAYGRSRSEEAVTQRETQVRRSEPEHDSDAAAKVLCAHYGKWRWEQITDKAKDEYRYAAREIAEAYEEGTTDCHMPVLYDLGIGINYGGAGAPDCA